MTPEALAAAPLLLGGDIARQIAVVLRLRAGEEVVLFDGQGEEVRAALLEVAPRRVGARPLERRRNEREARTALHLFVALIRGPRFELVLQKAGELGVAAITPFVARRSVVRPRGEGVPARWQAIVREAVEQSGRGRLPVLGAPVSFAEACRCAGTGDLALCCVEQGEADLRALLVGATLRSVAVMVGPEGGLDAEEAAEAGRAGLRAVSLGPRILRAETAAIAACAAVSCLLGEWGPAVQCDEGMRG